MTLARWQAGRKLLTDLHTSSEFVPSRYEQELTLKDFAESLARKFGTPAIYEALQGFNPLEPADSITLRLAKEISGWIYTR